MGAVMHDASRLSDCLDFVHPHPWGQLPSADLWANTQELLILYLQASTKQSQQQKKREVRWKSHKPSRVRALIKCPNQKLLLTLNWLSPCHTVSPNFTVGWETSDTPPHCVSICRGSWRAGAWKLSPNMCPRVWYHYLNSFMWGPQEVCDYLSLLLQVCLCMSVCVT